MIKIGVFIVNFTVLVLILLAALWVFNNLMAVIAFENGLLNLFISATISVFFTMFVYGLYEKIKN
jgi:hypothetical protein